MARLCKKLSVEYEELQELTKDPIVAFSDASHMGKQRDKMRSTTGSCIFVYNCLVQWSFKMQTIAAGSSMESELIAASSTADKAVWFFNLMECYPFIFGLEKPRAIPVLIDNLACLSVTNHPSNNSKARHIALREFRIRDFHELGKIRPYWCPGVCNVADFFSKLLPKVKFDLNMHRMGITGAYEFDVDCNPLPAYQCVLISSTTGPRLQYFSDDWLHCHSAKLWKLFQVLHGRSAID